MLSYRRVVAKFGRGREFRRELSSEFCETHTSMNLQNNTEYSSYDPVLRSRLSNSECHSGLDHSRTKKRSRVHFDRIL